MSIIRFASPALLVVIFCVNASAQSKRASHWYFGWKAGIDFSTGIPVADTTGKLASIEGSASISDLAGHLLFYSNGETTWDKNHNPMPNGTGLLGDQSSVQSCLIVPVPGNNSEFYQFINGRDYLTDAIPKFNYSIINMTLNGGNGDVVAGSKNTVLFDHCTEELAGTMHCNATDYWILARKTGDWDSDIYAYCLSDSGLSAPTITHFNYPVGVGSLTFSQDGSLLAYTKLDSIILIYDFNNATGELGIRDSILLPTANYMSYSVAFSPDNSKLYASIWDNATNCYISQFDLNAVNISASRVDLTSVPFNFGSPNGYGFIGKLQLAPDQKIYISRWHQNPPYVNPETVYALDSIDVIQYPNLGGAACGFQRNFLCLLGKPTQIGLPNFISNFTGPAKQANCETGLAENVNDNRMDVFPNPLQNSLKFDPLDALNKYSICLLDISGKVISKQNNLQGRYTLETTGMAPGLYILSIYNSSGVSSYRLVHE